jgi:putative transcriptional regulator
LKIRLQEILENQNKTIYSLSKEIGVAQNNLSKIVKGETTSIKYDILENLCIALKITPNDIFEIDYPYPTNQIYSKSLMKNYNEEEETQSFNPSRDMSPDELEEYNKLSAEYQIRFEKELKLDELISNFIDKLIEELFLNLNFESSIIETLEKSKGYDYFTTNLKVEKFHTYFYRFLNHHLDKRNERFIKFLNNIKHIYENGGLEKLSDSELDELRDTVEFLNNETNKKD